MASHNSNCTGFNTDDEINTSCDNFEETICHKQMSNDSLRDHLLHSDNFIIDILRNTENLNESHLMAAINYYQSCTTNSKEKTSTRKEKIVQLISFLFNGWLSPLGSDNNRFNISKNISDDKLFNLTSLILPLIFQNGRTSIFSFNPVKSGEGIEEQIFKFLENLKAQENKEELAKGVFNLYSDIKNIDWNVLFESIFRELKYESYKNLKIIVYNPDSLQKVCDIHMLAMNTTSGKRYFLKLNVMLSVES
ncbi:hypothetical protein Smp_171110 [Schistosoma mansoni]|uniref:hypothetical protein n=1 Tax=Schistosoma mansoni TaxID=6183 RepID=UPI0001A61E21|nr:hypothetical protein Smp_171110 [Schistosoma mansoni]|eukprot:XP_018650348.1 hypothetical protein Smp_171110 [Schistosoma mansoni]